MHMQYAGSLTIIKKQDASVIIKTH